MAATIEDIRNKLKAQQERTERSGSNGGDNAIYPFWNAPEGSTSIVRFLPDDDPNNTFFWRERLVIKLQFPGVLNDDENKPVTVVVPCMEMFAESCPILSTIRPWFIKKENTTPSEDEQVADKLARKFWKKRSYVFQGFVVDDAVGEDTTPDNPIRRFVINPSIIEIIRSGLFDTDMEDNPTDYVAGRDFKISKTKRGQYADYSNSSWSMKARALSDSEMAAIQEHKLFDLKDYLPSKPDEDHVVAIQEMFEASVAEELYDMERWGSLYKPSGFRGPQSESTKTTTSAAPAKVETETPAVVEEETAPVAETTSNVDDALAKLKARTAKMSETTPEVTTEETPTVTEKKHDANDVLAMIRSRDKTASN